MSREGRARAEKMSWKAAAHRVEAELLQLIT
jgi:hypothetical protein